MPDTSRSRRHRTLTGLARPAACAPARRQYRHAGHRHLGRLADVQLLQRGGVLDLLVLAGAAASRPASARSAGAAYARLNMPLSISSTSASGRPPPPARARRRKAKCRRRRRRVVVGQDLAGRSRRSRRVRRHLVRCARPTWWPGGTPSMSDEQGVAGHFEHGCGASVGRADEQGAGRYRRGP